MPIWGEHRRTCRCDCTRVGNCGAGLGLFGVLSIIRLGSAELDHEEIAYYFAALAFGILAGFVGPTIPNEAFVKVLTTEYTRSTLVLGDGTSRLTVDIRLRCIASDGRTVSLDDDVLIEPKSLHQPTEADHLLWDAHHRQFG